VLKAPTFPVLAAAAAGNLMTILLSFVGIRLLNIMNIPDSTHINPILCLLMRYNAAAKFLGSLTWLSQFHSPSHPFHFIAGPHAHLKSSPDMLVGFCSQFSPQ
jgi:hypothetical protein